MAVFLKAEILAIEKGEAEAVANVLEEYQRLYGMGELSEKTMFWINASIVLAKVYGTRAYASFQNGKKKQPKPHNPGLHTVTPAAPKPQQQVQAVYIPTPPTDSGYN